MLAILVTSLAVAAAANAQTTSALPQQNNPTKVEGQSNGATTAPMAAPQKAAEKPKPKTWRVRVITDAPVTSISIRAKDAPLVEIAADLERKLKIRFVLTPLMKQQTLTTEFVDFPLEAAARLLAPQAAIDYVINGGADSVPSEKEPLAVYLLAYNETLPPQLFYNPQKSNSTMIVGYVAGSEEEAKEIAEVRKKDLQVTIKDNLFTVKVHKQYLTDVLDEIAVKAGIPFSIFTTNANQKEVDEVVTLDVNNAALEDLVRTWFPNAIRLYLRTDLASYVSRPLRLTIEQTKKVQAERNSTP